MMSTTEKVVLALLVITSVSAELSVLVTGNPQYALNADFEVDKQEHPMEVLAKKSVTDQQQFGTMEALGALGNRESWGSSEEDVEAGNRLAYERFLGIDPLANSFLNDIYFNEGDSRHKVKKRILPIDEPKNHSPEDLDSIPTSDMDGSRQPK